jgi:hypothetical protein
MQAMREGSSVRNRRRRRRAPSPTDVPLEHADDALPLEEMGYDPATMGDPPGARGAHPDDSPDASHATGAPEHRGGTAPATDGDGTSDDDRRAPEKAAAGAAAEEISDRTEPTPAPEPQRRARPKRPSVPSWDDIMFGTRPPS